VTRSRRRVIVLLLSSGLVAWAGACADPALTLRAQSTLDPAAADPAEACAATPVEPAAASQPVPAEASPLTLLDNFHAIAEGQAYRSAQVRPETLEYAARTHGVRVVINLRGANPDESWYQRERAACDALGIRMIDVRFGSSELPAPEELLRLYDAFVAADGPVLMHCHSGADRSSMAAALWRMIVLEEEATTAAQRELSLRYGYFRSRRPAMADMVQMFVPDRGWIVNEYPRLYNEYNERHKDRR
jgi:protein tyrosine/serine phosphatase